MQRDHPTRLSCLKHLFCTCSCTVMKKKVPFGTAIGNVELVSKWSTKHSHKGTARMKLDKETEDIKKRSVSMEINKVGTRKNKS